MARHERKLGGNYASLAEVAEKTWDRNDSRWNQHPPQSYLQMLAARGPPRTSGGATVATASARDADNSVLNKRQKIDAGFDLAAHFPYNSQGSRHDFNLTMRQEGQMPLLFFLFFPLFSSLLQSRQSRKSSRARQHYNNIAAASHQASSVQGPALHYNPWFHEVRGSWVPTDDALASAQRGTGHKGGKAPGTGIMEKTSGTGVSMLSAIRSAGMGNYAAALLQQHTCGCSILETCLPCRWAPNLACSW
jgi:hypothetical protein